jgi:outer membrane protein assembly factor BamB
LHLYALNPDGTKKWSFGIGAAMEGSPAIGPDGTIYVTADDRYLHAINPNGTSKWTYLANNTIPTSPCIASDGTIVFSAGAPFNARMYAVTPAGKTKWELDGPDADAVFTADGMMYVPYFDGLHVIDATGHDRATFKTGWYASTPAIGADGTIYFGSWDGNLYAIK